MVVISICSIFRALIRSKIDKLLKIHYNIYDVFYSKCSHQHVSANIPATFRVTLLQNYKRANVVNRDTIAP